MTLTNTKNKSYEIQWCGISNLTGELIFDLAPAYSFADGIEGFSAPACTETLLYDDGKTVTEIRGFTQVNTVTRFGNMGAIRISLGKGD